MIAAPAHDPDFATHPCHGELAQHRFLREVLPYCTKKRIAVDVGAHIGLWTRMLTQKFEHVVAFEPVAENFACLQENVKSRKASLENVALGAFTETCDLVQHGANSGCWRVDPLGMTTEMRTLDSYGLRNIDLLKIDVEGSEGDVIAGGMTTLLQSRPVVVFEDNGLGQKIYGSKWLDPKTQLGRLRYAFAARYQKDEIWLPL